MRKFFLYCLMIFVLCWCLGLAVYVSWVNTIHPYNGKAEGIVVLTGGDGRVEAGLNLLEQHRAARLLVSGVHHDVKINELLALNHRDQKLAERIDLGFLAQDTLGNADETAAWVEKYKIESLIIVTAHYHMPRALVHLGNQLPDVSIYPYPVVPKLFKDPQWYKNREALRSIVRDYNKLLLTYPQIIFMNKA